MAFDPNTMFFTGMGNLRVECGEENFTTSGTTKEVSTHLSKCYCAIITQGQTTADAETLACDRTITAGTITVSRVVETGGSITNNGNFNYMFIGV